MNSQVKPPTQGVSVDGFRADVYASDEEKIDWIKLIHLPKFQMFMCETISLSHANVMQWIGNNVRLKIQEMGETEFFNLYNAWHSNKGYWVNEDVYGNLLGDA